MTIVVPRAGLASRDVRLGELPRQAARFLAVGVLNTGLFLGFYLGFRVVLSAVVANVLATVVTTVIGTSANGHVTFGVKGPVRLRQHVQSMAVTGLGLVITTVAVQWADGALGEVVLLTVASAVAGGVRFVLLRWWVFAGRRASVDRRAGQAGVGGRGLSVHSGAAVAGEPGEGGVVGRREVQLRS